MNLLRDAPLWAQLLLVALLVGAALQDVIQRRISNWLCLGVMTAAVPAALATGPTIALWQNGLCFALLLAIGVPLFAAKWLGGGDVKLIAALGLWVNLAALAPLVATILISGGVLAAVSLFVQRGRAARDTKGLPYGVAIAVGASIVLLQPALTEQDSPTAPPLDLKAARERAAAS